MLCPYCRSDDIKVIDSRDAEEGRAIRRRRECVACRQRFTTFERAEGVSLVVVKRDGTREPFDRAKVVSGLSKACANRPVSDRKIRAICDEVEDALRDKGGEIPSEDIGREVLARLREVDEIAFVRFASVYREFSDVADFERVIQELEKATPQRSGGANLGVGGRG
jgi:transcriptional repressor NrdR